MIIHNKLKEFQLYVVKKVAVQWYGQHTVRAAPLSLSAALKHSATVAGSNFSCAHPTVGKAIDDILSFTAVLKHSAIICCSIYNVICNLLQ